MSSPNSNSQVTYAVARPERSEEQELLHVGRQCSHQSCMLVDFLPIKCLHCSAPFCQDHFLPESHSCEKWDKWEADRRVLECPLCSTPIAIPPGEDPNVRMGQHVDECFAAAGSGKTPAKSSTVPTCARARCDKKLWAPIQCDKCGMKFCATHRHPDSHACVSTGVASGAGTSKESRLERAPIPLINPVNSASAKNAAGLAALKRSMQNASKKVTDKVATTVNASSSSPSTSTSVRTPPRVKQAVPISASASQSSSVASSSKNVFSSKDRRATAERKSQLRAMQERQKKGLLSKAEQEKLQALEAEMRDKGDCTIM